MNNGVPRAGLEERRFCVLDVADHRMGDKEYFRKLHHQIHNGGRAAMLAELLTADLSGWDERDFPRTQALLDQIQNSMNPIERFWFGRLQDGRQTDGLGGWQQWVSNDDFHRAYLDYCQDIGVRNRRDKAQFGKEIRRLCPRVRGKKAGQPRRPGKEFPPLEDCRASFEDRVRIPVDWDEPTVGQKQVLRMVN